MAARDSGAEEPLAPAPAGAALSCAVPLAASPLPPLPLGYRDASWLRTWVMVGFSDCSRAGVRGRRASG